MSSISKAPDSELPENPNASGTARAMTWGAIGFALVSLAAFAVWAAGEKWLQGLLGEPGLYGACALVFICLAGVLLYPLMPGRRSVGRFYAVFIPAFVVYALVWSACWFFLRFGLGEWLASLLGTSAFVAMVGWRLNCFRSFGKVSLIVFGLHSAGYFIGGQLMRWVLSAAGSDWLHGLPKMQLATLAKLSWGLAYGLGFGAGIGYVFHAFQAKRATVTAS